MRASAAAAPLVALLTLAGCSYRSIEVGYPPAAANRALLAKVTPRRVVVADVADRRMDRGRIGVQLENGEPIVTTRAVTDIVRDALVTELGKNGHEVVAGPGDVVVAAEVEEFWLDATGRSENTQFVGRVALAVVVAEGHSGERLLGRRYVGLRRQTGEADSSRIWREVMDAALARAIHDVATDPDVVVAMGHTPR